MSSDLHLVSGSPALDKGGAPAVDVDFDGNSRQSPTDAGADQASSTVAPAPPAAACANGLDDDADGKTDLADPGCSSSTDTDET